MAIQSMIYDPTHGATSEKIEIRKQFPINDEYGNIKYIGYLLRKTLNDGSVVEFYKVSAFFRLTRVSKSSKENQKFMAIHTDIVRAMYATNISTIEIICNIMKPEPIGLVYLYGVQSTGNSLAEAMRKCSGDFEALKKSFQGTHRTAHIGPVSKEVMQWVFKKIGDQKYVTVVKGIPAQRGGSGNNRNVINADNSTEEQIEQFLAGASETEFCLMLMATPISQKYLIHWLTKSLDEATRWEKQKQGSTSLGMSIGIPMTVSMNNSTGTSTSRNTGTSSNAGTSINQNESHGTSTNANVSHSDSKTLSDSSSSSSSVNDGTSHSDGTNHSDGRNFGNTESVSGQIGFSKGANVSISGSVNNGWSRSDGTSTSDGTSHSVGRSDSTSHSQSEAQSDSYSNGWGTNDSVSSGKGWNESKGQTAGAGRGTNMSTSSGLSGGLNFGANISKSYQWVDRTVEYITEILKVQNDRLRSMSDGDGGFFVDMYISTDSEQDQKAIESLSQTAWINQKAVVDLLRCETPDRKDQRKLGLHMQAMSPCMEIIPNEKGGYYYKYASILTSSELASYTHPPRISIGGLDNSMEDLPVLRVPTDRQNKEIFLGNVITGERYSYEMACKYRGIGYMTDYKFTIGNDEMHHAFISGASRSGKSVLASRMVLEMYQNAPYVDKITGEKKRKRVLVLDPKGEWRQMASMIPKGKFKFYSVGKTNYHPLRMNLLRVPKHISAYNYFNLVVEHFCSAYGLLDRAIAQISEIIYNLYDKCGAFDHPDDPNWANEVTKDVTLEDVYDEIEKRLHDAEQRRNTHDAEAQQTYLTRLVMYHLKHSNEYVMFCNRGGDSADILLGEDDFTVIESNGLSASSQRFFFILLMNSIYEHALAHGPRGFYSGSYETVVVLEEANSILISSGQDDTSGQKSINRFNELIDKAASLGLFFWVITQKIASMPDSVIANSGLVFIGRTPQEQDVKVALSALGFDTSFKDLEYKKFIPRLTTGVFLVKVSKGERFELQTPVCIKAAMLQTVVPSDSELEVLLQEHDLERELNNPI